MEPDIRCTIQPAIKNNRSSLTLAFEVHGKTGILYHNYDDQSPDDEREELKNIGCDGQDEQEDGSDRKDGVFFRQPRLLPASPLFRNQGQSRDRGKRTPRHPGMILYLKKKSGTTPA